MRTASYLFLFGLLLRLLFWWAGPSGGLGWHVGFQGDAPVWQDLCMRLAQGASDAELRLPWRAPGMLGLVSALWDGGAVTWHMHLLFALAGAAIAPLVWLLLRQFLDQRTAVCAASLCAVSTNLMLLSSGVQVEALYLALVLLTLCYQTRLDQDRRWLAARWGVLHGLLCLLRGEHILTFVVLMAVARLAGTSWRSLGVSLAACAVVVLPWQIAAVNMVSTFNNEGTGRPSLSLPWDDAAALEVEALPAFAQKAVFELVDTTVAQRGGARVQVADLEIVRQAYGTWPEPLPWPFLTLNGPLNFFLANAPEADSGNYWAALDRPPLLIGGKERFPAWLSSSPGQHRQFSLDYPPHLDRVRNGYVRGFEEILADPAAAGSRVLKKLWHAAEGATGGIGGYAFPIGLSGQRRSTDFVTASGTWPAIWRVAVLAIALFGLWRLRRNRQLWPLLAFAATKLIVVVLFFGYARHGALCVPVIAVGVASVWSRFADRNQRSWYLPAGLVLLAGLLIAEVVRTGLVTATVDGKAVTISEPFAPNDFSPRVVQFR